MCYLYERALTSFQEKTAIKVENIKGDILLYPENDTMWPSKYSAEYIKTRLKEKKFKYSIESIGYEYVSHILVPMNPSKLKMFKVERKHPEECKNTRNIAFEKCIHWIQER